MLLDVVKKYYGEEYDLNCAETMLYAANEEYGLNLSKETFKTMAAFGGGMGVESTCGVITGAISVLGILFTKERAHESDYVKTLTQEFIKNFNKECNSLNCDKLKELYRNDEIRCLNIVEKGAVILDNIVTRERNKH
ncbi:C-GCAxxG-C-C family (seleno)protein [Clostridium sp. UBA5119]|uniref:C-GCAxxG-C-C family (seleno)protein n=1 Tax=Clostridium sp. UBA5119 TaxID=1946366 RepID=UPI0032172EC5